MFFSEMSNEQRRQLIDAQQAFAAWRPASNELHRMGSLIWSTARGKRYLYEQHQKVRKSKGRETPALRAEKEQHDARRKTLTAAVKSLGKRLDEMAPVNRALRIGRVPRIAARIIRELDREGLLGSHIIIGGTNALYAYEGATGTLLNSEHVATTDADLLWDSKQSLLLATTSVAKDGIIGLLRRVDPTFRADYGLNPTNNDGYIVDLLCAPGGDGFQTMRANSDVEATEMPGLEWLISSPPFETVVIGDDGYPLRMVVPDPRTFALHKLWVSQRSDRQALKRPRDGTHAKLLANLIHTYIGEPITARSMPWLPKELASLAKDLKLSKVKL